MVRSVKNHHQEEEEDDEDFISRTTDGSSYKDGRRNDQKASSHRSKHSETEQRRRSKINERFQILRDLIPQNDQKRDRASFLLEVIQYIQFLQEKLQFYEGTYQGWTPEPAKLMPWRGNFGADNFADQSLQPIKNGSVDEGNIVLTPAMLSNAQNLVEPELSGLNAFKTADHGTARAVSMEFEARPPHNHQPQGSFPDVDLLASQSRPETWNSITLSSEDAILNCTPNELEESSISNAYSKGMLNNLMQSLGSSGVDLSQANISVQFDIRKGTCNRSTSTLFGIKDHDFLAGGNQATTYCGDRSGDDVCVQAHKRPRIEQNQ